MSYRQPPRYDPKAAQMKAQKRRAAMAEFFSHEKLCPACQKRDPWVAICDDCEKLIREYPR